MWIDLSSWASVQSNELVHKVFACLLRICAITLKICEPEFRDGAESNLLLKQIHLVKEQDQGWVLEPMRISNGLPEHQRFLHLILDWVLASLFSVSLAKLTPSLSSARHWSYPLMATRNIRALTFSKQWIHFFLSDRCPPTSNIRYWREPRSNTVSVIPVVRRRARSTSWSVGTNSLLNKRSRSTKKLLFLWVSSLEVPGLLILLA